MITESSNNLIILVDAFSYIHRAYHAFPPLTTNNGQPTWVIYGVINMLKSLLIRHQPTHMIIIFDAKGKTFRNNIFQKYKANRKQPPEDLCIQIEPLYQIIQAMGIPTLRIPYVEADDVIGTLAKTYEKCGKNILISTNDKDMTQIVSSHINLINTTSNIILNPELVKKKFGVPPSLMIDYLSLTGDESDNIPGVPKIGAKTAQILLNKIGNLDILYQNLNKIETLGLHRTKSIKKTLCINKEIAFLSYQLASIKTDVALSKKDYQLLISPANTEMLLFLFEKYELKKWLIDLKLKKWLLNVNTIYNSNKKFFNKFPTNDSHNHHQISNISTHSISNTSKKIIEIIYNIDTLRCWAQKIYTSNSFAFNIYTDTNDVFTANITAICISISHEENAFIPINNNIINNEKFLHIEKIFFVLQPIFENQNIQKIGQNFKFNYSIFRRYNIELVGMIFDITLEFYTLYGTSKYKDIKKFLDENTFNTITNFKKTFDEHNQYITLSKNIKLQSSIASKLINAILDVHHILWPKIKENKKLKKIFEEIEMPLISVLSRIENYGVLIDKKLLHSHSIELNNRLHQLKNKAYQLVNTSFNLSSTKQLQEILYIQQKLPILKKTPKGSPSTSEEVLKRLSKKNLIPKIILQYRGLSKLKSTYTNKLTTMINKCSNRIHTSYHQTRTSTGRLSSANPNLQNIPNRNHEGRKIRQAFIAPKNFLIMSADYSQIELRIMAHLSHDDKLIKDFTSGVDIHAATASEIFLTALHLVTGEQRHLAKTINFGLIYGMSAFGLARQLSVTCKEAQKYVDLYFQRYPGIMQYMQYIRNNANKHGYVSTLDGRKLYLPNIHSTNISQKKSAERAAINAPMQGSAADIMKRAMISIDHWLKKEEIPARIIIQVHDELVFEVKNNIIDFTVKNIKKLMEECFVLDVPLKVDIGIGKNWEQAH